MMKMFRMGRGALSSSRRRGENRNAATRLRTEDAAQVVSLSPRSIHIGLVLVLNLTAACGLSTAHLLDQPMPNPGIMNPMDPHAYMRELAGRLGSAGDKNLLLRGTEGPQTLATASSGPRKPSADNSVPVRSRHPVIEPPQQVAPVESNKPAVPMESNATLVRNPIRSAVGRSPTNPATWLSTSNHAAQVGLQEVRDAQIADKKKVRSIRKDSQATHTGSDNPSWSLGSDLEKYRAHALAEGSRDSGQNLARALGQAGLAVNDGINIFLLGYASDRAQAFRSNDGKSILDEPGKVPQRTGETLGNAGECLYSLADLIALDALRDPCDDPYMDNHPFVRPILFAGRTVNGIWKTTEEAGNAVTWGLFDNVTGCAGLLLEDIIEMLKHSGEAVTNLARLPMHMVGAKDENAEMAMDWVLLVPLEWAGNSAEMKGFANMQDYETAFADKGVIGSIVEVGGSSFVLYRAVDEATDKMKKDDKSSGGSNTSGGSSGGSSSGGSTGSGGGGMVVFYQDGRAFSQ
jgi:hypothetical protein